MQRQADPYPARERGRPPGACRWTPDVAGVQGEGACRPDRAPHAGRTASAGHTGGDAGTRAARPTRSRGRWHIHQQVLVWSSVLPAARSPLVLCVCQFVWSSPSGSGGRVWLSSKARRSPVTSQRSRSWDAGVSGLEPIPCESQSTYWVGPAPGGGGLETTPLRLGLTEDKRLPAWTRAVSWSEGR